MANFTEVLESTQNLFDSVLEDTSIPEYLKFQLLNNSDQKEVYQVKKNSDLVKTLSNGVDVVVILNEDVFDYLEDDQKELLLEEALNGVFVTDKGRLSIEKKDFTTYSGLLQKYGADEMIRLSESVKSIYEQLEAEAEEMEA